MYKEGDYVLSNTLGHVYKIIEIGFSVPAGGMTHYRALNLGALSAHRDAMPDMEYKVSLLSQYCIKRKLTKKEMFLVKL